MDYLKRTFLNKDERDFMHAVVPLPSERRLSNEVKPEEQLTNIKTENGSIGEKSTHSQNSGRSTTTLESLRAEVDSDIEADGHNTAYDRMYNLDTQEISLLSVLRTNHSLFTNFITQQLTPNRQSESYQQGYPRHGYGQIPVATFRPLWLRLDGRQPLAPRCRLDTGPHRC